MKDVLNGTNAFIIYVENCSLRIYVYIKKKKLAVRVYNPVTTDPTQQFLV